MSGLTQLYVLKKDGYKDEKQETHTGAERMERMIQAAMSDGLCQWGIWKVNVFPLRKISFSFLFLWSLSAFFFSSLEFPSLLSFRSYVLFLFYVCFHLSCVFAPFFSILFFFCCCFSTILYDHSTIFFIVVLYFSLSPIAFFFFVFLFLFSPFLLYSTLNLLLPLIHLTNSLYSQVRSPIRSTMLLGGKGHIFKVLIVH